MYDLVDVTEGRVPYKKALVRHKKYETLFLLPTSQVKDKNAVNPQALVTLCEEMREEYDYIIINDIAEKAAQKVLTIMEAERYRVARTYFIVDKICKAKK